MSAVEREVIFTSDISAVEREVKYSIIPTFAHVISSTCQFTVIFFLLTVLWDNFLYAVTISNHKVYVSKRRHLPTDPAVA